MSKNKAVSTELNLNQIQAIGEWGIAELQTLKETIGAKVTVPQFNLFMYQMNRMGLDPFLGHGVPIPYGNTVNIRVEYEGIKALAQKSDGYQGIYTQTIHENDEFFAESDDDGVITKVHIKIAKPPRGKVVGAYAIAKREGNKDFIVISEVADFEKYVKKNPSFWKLENGGIDPDMAKKFAATRAAKGQFNIADVVESNSLALNAGEPIYEYQQPTRRDITPEVNSADAIKQESSQLPPPVEQENEDEVKIKQARAEMLKKLKQLGVAGKKATEEYINERVQIKGDSPTLAELQGLLKIMDLEIQQKQAADEDRLDDGNDDDLFDLGGSL